jgi:cation:H+ antiporter
MSTPVAIVFFLGSLALTLVAAGFFADRLDHVGPRLGLPEAIVGLLTALAADAPEISAAVVALVRGAKEVSLGVVLGSNAFNLAAMVGFSALLTGAVTIERKPLLVESFVGGAAMIVAVAVVLGVLPAPVALVLFVGAAAVYLVVASQSPAQERHHERPPHKGALWKSVSLIVPAVALIVAGAAGMVRAALVLADRWHLPAAVVGLVVLAVLTSVPNAYTAVRLGLAGRSGALVSETLSSNTINLVGGVIVPALAVGLAARSALVAFNLAWVVGMTVITVAMLARSSGLRRGGGTLLIVLYAAFVATQFVFAYK